MAEAIEVLVVDDHALFRAGVRALLAPEAAVRVVGEAASGEEAVEQARRLEPDVIVMDLSMPEVGGVEAVRRIRESGIDSRVVVLTAHAEEEYLAPLMEEASVSDYLNKSNADRDLAEAVRAAAREGRQGRSGRTPRRVREQYREARSAGAGPDPDALSPRERQVLALTAEQYSSREIGDRLGISPKTVDTYRTRLKEKLGLDHRSELVRLALRAGLLGAEEPGGPAARSG